MEKKPKTKEELGNLHPREIELIWYIRNKYRFGPITIENRDGLPYRILKVVEYQTLGEG